MNTAALIAVPTITGAFFYLVNFKEKWGRYCTTILNLIAFTTAAVLILEALGHG